MLTCPKNSVDITLARDKFIDIAINSITNSNIGRSNIDFKATLTSLPELTIPMDPSFLNFETISFVDIMVGFIPASLYDIILQIVGNKSSTCSILEVIMGNFKQFLFKNIWVPRCKEVIEWEKSEHIKNNRRKQKIRTNNSNNNSIDSDNNITNNNNNYNNNNNILYRNIKHNYLGLLNSYINRGIKEVFNWPWIYKIGFAAGP